MLKQSFQSPQAYALQAKIKLGGSSSGPCKACRANANRRNPRAVPLHPNCKCGESSK